MNEWTIAVDAFFLKFLQFLSFCALIKRRSYVKKKRKFSTMHCAPSPQQEVTDDIGDTGIVVETFGNVDENSKDLIYVYMCHGEKFPPATGTIHGSDEICPGIIVDYTADGRIVGFEILYVSTMTGVAETDSAYVHRHVSCKTEGDSNSAECFALYLHASRGDEVTEVHKTEDDRVFLGKNSSGLLRCLLVRAPSASISLFTRST